MNHELLGWWLMLVTEEMYLWAHLKLLHGVSNVGNRAPLRYLLCGWYLRLRQLSLPCSW